MVRDNSGKTPLEREPFAQLERFLRPSERANATHALAAFGSEALPVLDALFSGEATNEFGVPYASLGMPVDCGLVVARMLGPRARPLEAHLVRAFLHGNSEYAAAALGALGTLGEASVVALAGQLNGSPNVAHEAAAALIKCGALDHPVVRSIRDSSARAARTLRAVARSLGVSPDSA